MDSRSILITGCSSGIGYDAAHTLQKNGWRVFASCRKQEDCDRLAGEGLETVRLDYQDSSSIDAAIAEVLAKTGGTLDALFNNGAYAIPGAVEDLTRDALRDIFETNLFGQIELTNKLLPTMRNQTYARIVYNSSVLGFISTPYRGAYSATKYAMEALVVAQRIEYRDSHVKLILIEPGPIDTDFRKNAATQFKKWIDFSNAYRREYYEETVLKRLNNENQPKDKFELPSAAVTAKLIKALESKRPKPVYMVTFPTYVAAILKRVLPVAWLDRILASQ